jgi:bifunctional ADP-heptose synthase (sugar kinase/adenylyltransferase)
LPNTACIRCGSDAQLNTIVKLRVIGRAQQLIRLDFGTSPITKYWR